MLSFLMLHFLRLPQWLMEKLERQTSKKQEKTGLHCYFQFRICSLAFQKSTIKNFGVVYEVTWRIVEKNEVTYENILLT